MTKQDFSRKIVIVLDENLASWQLSNTVAHIAGYLGHKIKQFLTDETFVTKDGVDLPRNSQYGMVTLKATKDELKKLIEDVRKSNVLWMVYVQDMIDMIDDAELAEAIGSKRLEELNLLGIGLFGTKDELKELTRQFKLWK